MSGAVVPFAGPRRSKPFNSGSSVTGSDKVGGLGQAHYFDSCLGETGRLPDGQIGWGRSVSPSVLS